MYWVVEVASVLGLAWVVVRVLGPFASAIAKRLEGRPPYSRHSGSGNTGTANGARRLARAARLPRTGRRSPKAP
jgi:hypothetical protein